VAATGTEEKGGMENCGHSVAGRQTRQLSGSAKFVANGRLSAHGKPFSSRLTLSCILVRCSIGTVAMDPLFMASSLACFRFSSKSDIFMHVGTITFFLYFLSRSWAHFLPTYSPKRWNKLPRTSVGFISDWTW
jgi:hypothetical protein